MSKRYDVIGIKQAIRLEWMQKTTNLMLAGVDAKKIREDLHEFLANKKGDGTESERGKTSRTQVVNMLMNIWVSLDKQLLPFRDASLEILRENPSLSLAVHWGMISATYPFWFNVALLVGRLLSMQEQVTQAQIFKRLKEQYGDRETVSRYARYVVRSFIFWGVLKDSKFKGCYELSKPMGISDPNLAILLYEAALHADKEGRAVLGLVKNNPAFFPFQLPVLTGGFISQQSNTIDVVRYGLDDELLKLREEL